MNSCGNKTRSTGTPNNKSGMVKCGTAVEGFSNRCWCEQGNSLSQNKSLIE